MVSGVLCCNVHKANVPHTQGSFGGCKLRGPVLSSLLCVLLKHLMWIKKKKEKKLAVPTVVSPRICFNGSGPNVPSCSKTDRQINKTVALVSYGWP